MHRHANELAKALSRRRKDVPRRPIIFVAYDLGGIILKWTLAMCHKQDVESKYDLRSILTSTQVILFFGTPHAGSHITLLDAVGRLASIYMDTADIALEDLLSHSYELEKLQSRYTEASARFNSIIFYGEDSTTGLKALCDSGVIIGNRKETLIALHGDHRNLVRLTAKANGDYETILHHLSNYFNNALVAVKKKWNEEDHSRSAAKVEPASEDIMLPKPLPPVSRSYIERRHIQPLITEKLLPSGSLATNWIQEHENRFNRVIFVDASNQDQLEVDLQRSIRCLGPEYSRVTWKDAVAYLDGKEKEWLLFIDNADSPELDLRPYLPNSTHGAVLIATRNGQCVNYAPDGAVPVGDLEENEAMDLLHTTANVSPTSDTESLEIVRELGMLALSITQAGVYIRKTWRIDTYLKTFRRHRGRLLREQLDIGSEYTSPTYTAFDLSFHQLPEKPQGFLKLCAFLDHSLIPTMLFKRSTTSGFTTYTVLENHSPPESDKNYILTLRNIFGGTWDEVEFQDIVDSASKASFIDVSMDGLFYTVHPLLQIYIKDSLGEAANEHYCRQC
ncbi:hypothetical protein PIIN_07481 [Serendipita indica DSM 11827]|uniref:Uncharacterized protein n=1 Tax=Serendipita indica (strain DSM 11827) TaxID=1109443 RepID=G4TQD5_SERID|nr:hypothetical protein PIIN_07481 [Serendipita indica DSM 11827]